VTARVISPGAVTPADPSKLADIGEVTGVYVGNNRATNYYCPFVSELIQPVPKNPFKPGDTVIYLSRPLPVNATVKITYVPRQRVVTIKYSDMRYTHVRTGSAIQFITVSTYANQMNSQLWITDDSGSDYFAIYQDALGLQTSPRLRDHWMQAETLRLAR